MSSKPLPSWSRAALVAGPCLAALGLLDPSLGPLGLCGALLASAGLALEWRRDLRPTAGALSVSLAWIYTLAAWSHPTLNGDSPSYYMYLRSLFFDWDLDFGNELAFWGLPRRPPTPTGRPENVHAVGAACLWSPFFLLAHLYVKANQLLGRADYASDGFSVPYIRSLALGTGTLAACGAVALAKALAGRFGGWLSALAVAGTALASPLPYYLFVQPAMAHGLIFAEACLFVAVWMRAEQHPSRRAWLVLGGLLGALALTRWQSVVYLCFFAPLLVGGLRAKRLRWRWTLEAAAVALLVFLPQLVAWQVLFGSPLAVPQRQHGMDWTSPNLVEVLLSADRGLFSWTPLLALGLVGLLALSKAWPAFVAPSLAVFVCSAWINGGVKDWAAADAFGGRRFDLVIPLFAVGLAFVAGRVTQEVARRPWLPAAVALLLATLWNLGFMRLYRRQVFKEAAPAEVVAARQVGQLRVLGEELSLRVGGPRLRKLAYDFFVGEYLYWNVNLDGTIDVSAPDNRFLRQGWSQPRQRPGFGSFRWAFYPRACLSLPLLKPILLRGFIRIRTAPGLDGQSLTVLANGRVVVTRSVPAEWTDVPFEIPEGALVPGPNAVCFEFSRGAGENEDQAAAAVKLVQLP